MEIFEQALAHVLANEGGYVNDPADRGGETYRGIARRFHPDWAGWRIIDRARNRPGFPESLDDNATLQRQVAALYRHLYWEPVGGDRLPDSDLAIELMDTAVNMGVRRAARFLQEGLNLLNRNQKSWPDLVVDGWIGDKSISALHKCLRGRGGKGYLLKVLNTLQAERYLDIMRRDPTQERFARGWLNRT